MFQLQTKAQFLNNIVPGPFVFGSAMLELQALHALTEAIYSGYMPLRQLLRLCLATSASEYTKQPPQCLGSHPNKQNCSEQHTSAKDHGCSCSLQCLCASPVRQVLEGLHVTAAIAPCSYLDNICTWHVTLCQAQAYCPALRCKCIESQVEPQ